MKYVSEKFFSSRLGLVYYSALLRMLLGMRDDDRHELRTRFEIIKLMDILIDTRI